MSTAAGDHVNYSSDPSGWILPSDCFGATASLVILTAIAFDLLIYLVERHGHLADKQALRFAVWPDAIVEKANLASNVSPLQKGLHYWRRPHPRCSGAARPAETLVALRSSSTSFPSATMVCPVIHPASSEHSAATAPPMSAGVPARPIGFQPCSA